MLLLLSYASHAMWRQPKFVEWYWNDDTAHCNGRNDHKQKMKKALRETQTLRAGCSKAEPEIFAPPQSPFPGAQDRKI